MLPSLSRGNSWSRVRGGWLRRGQRDRIRRGACILIFDYNDIALVLQAELQPALHELLFPGFTQAVGIAWCCVSGRVRLLWAGNADRCLDIGF